MTVDKTGVDETVVAKQVDKLGIIQCSNIFKHGCLNAWNTMIIFPGKGRCSNNLMVRVIRLNAVLI